MYSLKRMAIEEGIYPKRFPTPVMAQTMADMIADTGRNAEMWLVLKMSLKTNPLGLMKMAPTGLKLFTRGRMKITSDSIRNKKQLGDLLKGLKEAK
jgi:hypothetical protein